MTTQEWQKKFSGKVKTLMESSGVKQSQLAKACDISSGRLSEYLSGKSMPTIFAVINIAHYFNVTIKELIDFGDYITNGE